MDKLTQSLLDADYSKYTYGKVNINKTLALKLNEIKFKEFKLVELRELARDLGMKNYSGISKQALVEEIELVRKQFCKKTKK